MAITTFKLRARSIAGSLVGDMLGVALLLNGCFVSALGCADQLILHRAVRVWYFDCHLLQSL
jgi:hypothetical protein